VLAGVRGRRSLELSGLMADGTILAWPLTGPYIARAREAIERGRPATGRTGDQLVIAGDLDHCADRIASLVGQGIDHVILSFSAGTTADRQDMVSRQLITAVTDRLA
jgi:alkanesulfonate monooxygenase SsuD/methylene tetrahydromethanopterin reductase-like flavin-dependent oxidoreductase (luciferase family)